MVPVSELQADPVSWTRLPSTPSASLSSLPTQLYVLHIPAARHNYSRPGRIITLWLPSTLNCGS